MSQQTQDPGALTFDMADRLRKALRVSGLGPGELADDLGYSRQSISAYLSGRVAPRRPIVIAWALRCGVPVEWLETGVMPEGRPDGGPGSNVDNDPEGGQVFDGTGWFPRAA